MSAVLYRVSNLNHTERGFELMEYDPNAPCQICGLPVGGASMGGTAICAPCDCGRKRPGAKPRDHKRKIDPWANRTSSTYFPVTEELAARRKVVELDPHPIHKEMLEMVERRIAREAMGEQQPEIFW